MINRDPQLNKTPSVKSAQLQMKHKHLTHSSTAQVSFRKRKEEECVRPGVVDGSKETEFLTLQGSCAYEVAVVVTACSKSVKAQDKPNPTESHAKELLAIIGYREMWSFFLLHAVLGEMIPFQWSHIQEYLGFTNWS